MHKPIFNRFKKFLYYACTERDYQNLADAYAGVCIDCGSLKGHGVEPDAEDYLCPACGQTGLCGMETALLTGRVRMVSR